MDNSFPVTLEEWNTALVKAIFLESSRVGSTLSRIDATGRIFEQLAGTRTKEEAKKCFLNSFGNDSSKIRRYLRDESQLDVLAQLKGYPSYFAILYLTLLAASADDDTHEEGDFRVRFAVLLGFNKSQTFSFSDLPKLWKRIEHWTRRKPNCIRLILPHSESIKNERLIGYSKRIAFPNYKDETLLRNILSDNKLDYHSTFELVNKSIHQKISYFSEIFKYEFFEFRSLFLNASMQKAYDSPFWGAVRDISKYIEKEQIKKNGQFCIQLDLSEPEYPELYLLMNDIAASSSKINKNKLLHEKICDYEHIYYKKNINDTLNALTALLQNDQGGFLKSRAGAALQSGCLPLFRDDFGYISSDGEFYDNSPLYLILHHEYAKNIFSTLTSFSGAIQKRDIKSTKWTLIIFEQIHRKKLETIADLLPDKARQFLVQGWMPPRPHMSGAARFGQAILLNPASNPVIHMFEAIKGCYIIRNTEGDELTSGSMVQGDEGLLIPTENLKGISGQAFCRYELTLKYKDTPVIFDIHVLDHAPYVSYRKIAEPHDWLTDGQFGTLTPLEDTNKLIQSKQETIVPLSGSQSLWQRENNHPLKCINVELHNIPEAFDWITEALALRFQRRSTLPFSELKQHIDPVSQVIGIPVWQLRRMLIAAGWLCVVHQRHAPYQSVSMAERTISVEATEQGADARIMGMFTRSERNHLQEALHFGERIERWSVEGSILSVGCIVLRLSGVERVHDFIEQFSLRLIDRDEWLVTPLSGVVLPLSQMQNVSTFPPDRYVSILQAQWQWSDEQPATSTKNGSLIRCQEKQRYRYFIRQPSGYWQTDSFAWALMVHVMYSEETFGMQNSDSDWYWSTKIIELPPSVIQWWIHIAGGCLSIADNGGFLFAGGKTPLWHNLVMAPSRHQALVRRDRALAIRKLSKTLQ